SFKAGLKPQINLSGNIPNLDRSISLVSQDSGGSEFQYQNQSYSDLDITLSKKIILTGGNISISSNISRYDLFGQNHLYHWSASLLKLGYRQPLFEINHLKWDNEIESMKMELSRKQFIESREDLAVQIISSFFDLYISQQLLINAEFNVTINDTIYTISKGRFSVGKIAENELLQSELAVMNSQNNYRRTKLNFERTQEKFKTLLGIPLHLDLEIILPEKLENLIIEPDTALDYAKSNGSSFLNWKIQKLESEKAVQTAKKNQWLNAELSASLGYDKTAQNFDDLLQKPLDSESFSIGFDIPLSRSRNHAELLEAEQRKAQTIISADQFEIEFEQDIKYQVKEFKLMEEQLNIATISDSIAIRRFKTAKDRYLIDKTDITTLFLAQNELDATHRQYYQTLKDYWIAYYQLRRMTLYDFEKKTVIN
ncbi:MAG: TolC family protein, partial [Fidelibacterota bacterium]